MFLLNFYFQLQILRILLNNTLKEHDLCYALLISVQTDYVIYYVNTLKYFTHTTVNVVFCFKGIFPKLQTFMY